ncbi:DUF1398 family protein [Neobacillus drentensis]|uniref:DUF1398 domain-containing protein n=1 Tax=Neobacillus drentensis TaxID=220684 RepID=UPI003000C35F
MRTIQKLVNELKNIGVSIYEYLVEKGINKYYNSNGECLKTSSNGLGAIVNKVSSQTSLKHILLIHQKGETDYPTFCKQAAESGVEKWVSDLKKMKVYYIDYDGNVLLEENIPMFINNLSEIE